MVLPRSLGHLLLAAFCVPVALNYGATQTLTNCAQILSLSAEAANQEHPALIRAVVTCYVPSSQLCFVQDATAGIYVYPSPWPKDLAPGTVVEVRGVSDAGRFSPVLKQARITSTGEKNIVEPKRLAIEQLNSGRFDSQWVELEGVVQGMAAGQDVQKVQLVSGGSAITVLCFDAEPAITNWIDARVRLRGVAGTYYSGDQLTGFGLFVPTQADAEVLAAGSDPFARPMRTAGKLAWYSPDGAMDHRVRLRGLVTVAWASGTFFVEDQTGTVQVFTLPGQPEPKAGDMVELSGFVRNGTSSAPSLGGAVWKKIGTNNRPEPKTMSAVELGKRPPTGQLVSIEATVLNQTNTGHLSLFFLEQNGRIVPAFNNRPWEENLRGAKVKATGAWSACPSQVAAEGTETGPGIWLRSSNDLVVLSRPASTVGSVASPDLRLVLVGAGACIMLGGALAWRGYTTNRSSSDKVENLKKELVQMEENRERLGRNLHDHIIQSIYAMGLNIEECRQLLNEPSKAEPRLRNALEEVNAVIRELRNVIQGLETNAIQPAEFRTALKSLALMLGDEKSSRVRLDLDQNALDQLTPPQATELIHIAREAVSNSIRHGKAITNTFALHIKADKLRFTIEDDGCGFTTGAEEPKGYGLRNMAKRAESLGAEFTIHSKEGAGTRIVLDIPKQKQHFSNSESRARSDR